MEDDDYKYSIKNTQEAFDMILVLLGCCTEIEDEGDENGNQS